MTILPVLVMSMIGVTAFIAKKLHAACLNFDSENLMLELIKTKDLVQMTMAVLLIDVLTAIYMVFYFRFKITHD